MARSITENIVQHLRNETKLTIVEIIQTPQTTETFTLVREISGRSENYPDGRQDVDVQFLTRSANETTARKNSYEIFNLLREAENVAEYPAAVGKTGSLPVTFAHVDTMTRPYYIGEREGMHWYSFHAMFTYFEK